MIISSEPQGSQPQPNSTGTVLTHTAPTQYICGESIPEAHPTILSTPTDPSPAGITSHTVVCVLNSIVLILLKSNVLN